MLEVRDDNTTDFSGRRIGVNNNATGYLFLDPAMGGSLLAQTMAFSDLLLNGGGNNVTFVVSGRDGIGASFTGTSGVISGQVSAGKTVAIYNSGNGLLTFNANMFNVVDATGQNTMTLEGNGDMLVNGSILGFSTSNNIFAKAGQGTVTVVGLEGNFSGGTSITGGTLAR